MTFSNLLRLLEEPITTFLSGGVGNTVYYWWAKFLQRVWHKLSELEQTQTQMGEGGSVCCLPVPAVSRLNTSCHSWQLQQLIKSVSLTRKTQGHNYDECAVSSLAPTGTLHSGALNVNFSLFVRLQSRWKVTVYSDFALLHPQTCKFPRCLLMHKLSPTATSACGKRNKKFNFWGRIALFLAPFRHASISWAMY